VATIFHIVDYYITAQSFSHHFWVHDKIPWET